MKESASAFLTRTLPLCLVIYFVGTWLISAGDLNPPEGPIAGTMKTLQQIEPRTPIQSLAGNSGVLHVIDEPGSYYLTGHIVGETGKGGITIEADDVVLDLCGFTIRGVDDFPYAGINVGAGDWKNITVRNGTIRNWASSGIAFRNVDYARFESLHIRECNTGINAGDHARMGFVTCTDNVFAGADLEDYSMVVDCKFFGNGSNGLDAGAWAQLHRSTNCDNGLNGATVGSNFLLQENLAGGNSVDGIDCGNNGIVVRCVTSGNDSFGIDAGGAVIVKECVASGSNDTGLYVINGSTVRDNVCNANLDVGIKVAGQGSFVQSNIVRNNVAEGIQATGSSVSRNYLVENVATANDKGLTVDGASVVVKNFCIGNLTDNYDATGGNAIGELYDSSVAVDLTSSNGWLNFED